jgi:hypothetical protein
MRPVFLVWILVQRSGSDACADVQYCAYQGGCQPGYATNCVQAVYQPIVPTYCDYGSYCGSSYQPNVVQNVPQQTVTGSHQFDGPDLKQMAAIGGGVAAVGAAAAATAATAAAGVLASGASAYIGKKFYDHFKDRKKQKDSTNEAQANLERRVDVVMNGDDSAHSGGHMSKSLSTQSGRARSTTLPIGHSGLQGTSGHGNTRFHASAASGAVPWNSYADESKVDFKNLRLNSRASRSGQSNRGASARKDEQSRSVSASQSGNLNLNIEQEREIQFSFPGKSDSKSVANSTKNVRGAIKK